jgi:hypothetical protein
MNIYYLVTVILAILLINYIYNEQYEYFEDVNKKKVFIVWNDTINKQGLGDKLRGTIAIYQYCRLNNIECIFDATFSEFSKYLKNSKSLNPNLNINTPIASILNVYDDDQAIKNLIDNELKDKNEAYVFCNSFPQVPLSSEDLDFLNYITEPIDELKDKVDNLLSNLNNFTIQHFRFKDGSDPDYNKCEECYKLLKKTYNKTDILMSNSKVFKDYVLDRKKIKVIECDGCDGYEQLHVGNNSSSNVVEFTLIEYYILCKSKSINTYSEYDWISAFVYWPAQFYNIEIKNLKMN